MSVVALFHRHGRDAINSMFIHVAPALLPLCSALLLGVLSACATTTGNLTDSVKTPSTANSSETTDATPYLTLADFAEQLGYMTSLEARVLALNVMTNR